MKGPVIVAGAVARRVEFGGHVWALLQWILGLRQLGHPVLFLDRLEPDANADPTQRVQRFRQIMEVFGLNGAYSLDLGPDREPVGVPRSQVLAAARDADFLLNIMGYLDDPAVLGAARRRVFLDIDPGFPQMWEALGYCDMFEGHDTFLTVGRNVGQPDCTVPTGERTWIPISPPVVSSLWPPSGVQGRSFSSVGSWRGPYDPVEYEGDTYGLRVHEFRRFFSIPRDTGVPFEIALDMAAEDEVDAARLRDGGWRLVDPGSVANDPLRYREYLQGSRGEFQVAKNMYVRSRSGWFSDRTACYLASGRPALVQDTGLDGELTGGLGLVTFTSLEDAVQGVQCIEAEWARHSRAARELAMEHFDSRRVLTRLVDAVAA